MQMNCEQALAALVSWAYLDATFLQKVSHRRHLFCGESLFVLEIEGKYYCSRSSSRAGGRHW